MNVLIIAYYFPPQNTIASLRPYSWAKYFLQRGDNVTIATTKTPKKNNDLTYDLSKLDIIEEPIFKNKIPRQIENSNLIISIDKKEKKSLTKPLKKIVYNLSESKGIFLGCRYPDLRINWVKKTVKKLKEKQFDLVISTGCPYIVHEVAYRLKKNGQEFYWVVDWRDLWTQNSNYSGLKIFQKYEKKLEKKYHNSCNLITTVSDGLKDILSTITQKRVETIYNGYDPDEYKEILKSERIKNEKLVISYLGTIYKGFRDPEPLLIAISELIQEQKIKEFNIQLIFAGNNSDISDLIKKYSLTSCYKYLGIISREESLKLQYNSDVLLFLETEHKTKGILTGKLFEYLSLGREILAVGITENNSAGQLIIKANKGVCCGTEIDKIKKYIFDSVTGKRKMITPDDSVINFYTRENQFNKLLSCIENK